MLSVWGQPKEWGQAKDETAFPVLMARLLVAPDATLHVVANSPLPFLHPTALDSTLDDARSAAQLTVDVGRWIGSYPWHVLW